MIMGFQFIMEYIFTLWNHISLSIRKRCFSLNNDILLETLHKYGNCIAASIPLTFVDAIENQIIKRGDICLLCGTSAGFAIGGLLIKY